MMQPTREGAFQEGAGAARIEGEASLGVYNPYDPDSQSALYDAWQEGFDRAPEAVEFTPMQTALGPLTETTHMGSDVRTYTIYGLGKVDDATLLDAHQQTGGKPGDPAADTLLAEIKRRGLVQ